VKSKRNSDPGFVIKSLKEAFFCGWRSFPKTGRRVDIQDMIESHPDEHGVLFAPGNRFSLTGGLRSYAR